MKFDIEIGGNGKEDALEALDKILDIIKKGGPYQSIHILNREKVHGMRQIEQMIRENIVCGDYTIESKPSSPDYNNGTIIIKSSGMIMFKSPWFIDAIKDKLVGIDIDALTAGGVEMVFSVRTTDRL